MDPNEEQHDGTEHGTVREELATVLNLIQAVMRFNNGEFRHRLVDGLRMSEFGLLFLLAKEVRKGTAGLKVSDISTMLRVTSPTVTQFIKALEKKNWVERTPDETDRRVVRIKLSEAGLAVVFKTREATINSFKGLVEYLGEEESQQFADLLTKAYMYYESKLQNEPSTGGDNKSC